MVKSTYDFESQSEADLKKYGAYEYSMHPTTKVLCLSFKSSDSEKCYLFKYHQMQKRWESFPEQFKSLWLRWLESDECIFSAHNHFFETCIYENVLVRLFGWPSIPPRKKRCTAAKAAAVAIPRNLADAGAVMKLQVQKDFEGHRVMMKLCKPISAWKTWREKRDKIIALGNEKALKIYLESKPEPVKFYTPQSAPEEFETLYRYGIIDSRSEEKLDESLPDLTSLEQEIWFLDQKINWRGVAVDVPLINKIVNIMTSESKIMGKELDILTMGLVSSGNARNQILDFMTLEGIDMPDLKAKTVDDFLANGKVSGDAKKLLEIRRALSKASTAKYKKFQGCSVSDGRVRDLFMYHGASTGRWTGKNIQPQNFPRGVIKNIDEAIHRIETCDLDMLKMLYGENLMPLFSSVLRGMFIASPKHQLFVEDLSSIEARVLCWLAGQEDGLEMFRRGEDAYRVMAAAIFKKPISEITEEERQVGKAAVLGCGYQMGGKKFMSAAWDVYRAKVDIDLAKIAVTEFRKKYWAVTELWDKYNEAAIEAVENLGTVRRVGPIRFFYSNKFLWVQLPSGRRLAYREPQVTWKDVVLNGEGDVVRSEDLPFPHTVENLPKGWRTFKTKSLSYWAVNHKAKKENCTIPKWSRESIYGGKWAENITQAVARDCLAHSMLLADDAGFNILMHSHDELVSEALIGKFKIEKDDNGKEFCPTYRKILETVPPWAPGLPLKAAGWVGTRYKKG